MPRIAYENKRLGERKRDLIRLANQVLEEYAAQGYDLTLRQLYYQFVARGWLPNVPKSYDTLGGAVNDGRMVGLIDWDHITDRTRNIRHNIQWADPSEAIKDWAERWFGIDRWEDQPIRPEVWIEKDALVGIISSVCHNLDVTYFSCRGYTSQSEMWAASQRLLKYIEADQRVVILHLGDHDPSGIDMTRDIEDRLWTFIGGDYWRAHPHYSEVNVNVTLESMFEVKRIALTMDQVRELEPPPNPAKMTDSRAPDYVAQYGDESWELDALDPAYLSNLIEGAVWDLTDPVRMDKAINREQMMIAELKNVSDNWADIIAYLEDL